MSAVCFVGKLGGLAFLPISDLESYIKEIMHLNVQKTVQYFNQTYVMSTLKNISNTNGQLQSY